MTAALTGPGVFARLAIGKPAWLEALDGKETVALDLLEAKAGPKLFADIMPPLGQALDPSYSSNAGIDIAWSAGTTGDLANALIGLLNPVDALLSVANKYLPDWVGSSIAKVSDWTKKWFGGAKEDELKGEIAKELKEAANQVIAGKLQWTKSGTLPLFNTPDGKLAFPTPPDKTSGKVDGTVAVAKPKGLLGKWLLAVKQVDVYRLDTKAEKLEPVVEINSGIAVDKKLPWSWSPQAGESPYQVFAAFVVPKFLPLPMEIDVASNGCAEVELQVSDVVVGKASATDAVDADTKMMAAFNSVSGLLKYHTDQALHWGNQAVQFAKLNKPVQASNAIQLSTLHGSIRDALLPEMTGWAELTGAVNTLDKAVTKLTGGNKDDDWAGPLPLMKGPVQAASLPPQLANKQGFDAIKYKAPPAGAVEHSFILAAKSGSKLPLVFTHKLKAVRGADKVLLLAQKHVAISVWCENESLGIKIDGKDWISKKKGKVTPAETRDLWTIGEKHTVTLHMGCDEHDPAKFPSHNAFVRMNATLVQYTLTAVAPVKAIACSAQ